MRASVVIPCYRPDANFEKMLGDLNAQTCQDFDVVLADDGNTPPLAARVKATLKRPHRVIRFDQNRGIVAGLNACIADVRAPVVI
ncbi:MAG: glycosyltransferase family 2 protein, partial [Flavobacteriales bacterium]